VPSPCITGWKFAEGETVKLAQLGCETGFFPCLMKERGKKGEIKFVEADLARRPPIEEFMGPQRRFYHLVEKNKETGLFQTRAGKEDEVRLIRDWLQNNFTTLQNLMSLETL
jgi:pyruvate/2-oxoacid:ferredoxin oxidoreductase beta subunit